MTDANDVERRASVEHYEPPVFDIDEPLWVAEDEETGCSGVGKVRAEAVGNLVAVVESHGHEETGYVKVPGEVIERKWQNESDPLDWVRNLLP